MELREYATILMKNWVLIVITSILGVAAGAGFSLLATPEYQSRTQIYVSVRSAAGTTGDLVQGANFSRQIVNSYVDVAKTGLVLEPVIDELGLEMSANQLASHLTVASPTDTALINITASSPSPEQAAEIANAVGESFKNVVQTQLEPDADAENSLINLTTTQNALPPSSPVSPNIPMNIVLGLLVGLAIGVGIAVLRTVLDTRIHSLKDVEAITDKPLLGGVLEDPEVKKNPLVMQTKPHSPNAEAYRAFRTNLQFLNVDESSSIFVITSPNPGEGKSTTSINLALALAESGSRVALIEADLRLPKISKYLNMEGGAGLTDVLIGKAELNDVLQRWGRTQLYVLPAGRIPPNPSELLGSSAMTQIIDEVDEGFDYVIIDAPPILAVTDAAVIGHGKAGVLVAVASGATKRPELEAAIQTLDHAGSNMLGVVVTMLPAKAAAGYGYGNYGYGNPKKIEASLGSSHE
ncbi:chain length determinant protein [Corynebacterium efficiens YS-314]|uniref:non-specific protein-tyrosine kinase n=1 Tax=Corynebacterium efficiens (strain DSM 44549 / YS-314 / AJ 12310 / JCM 11189 / NBRC 100395) TaxID=196164 RepID=Q8FSM6_COREF|nr:polysaccharide biosynthesis tyrosine autokinase [Corynebacterium efficiens]EEW50937.1 chain length determinant protein [Corynebacterium efficiens YS-314]BAC17167.1 putative capsular polysaccharide biosynthesis protein [Corynebacterium efficiens YS-314]